jgi:hypothetical protein
MSAQTEQTTGNTGSTAQLSRRTSTAPRQRRSAGSTAVLIAVISASGVVLAALVSLARDVYLAKRDVPVFEKITAYGVEIRYDYESHPEAWKEIEKRLYPLCLRRTAPDQEVSGGQPVCIPMEQNKEAHGEFVLVPHHDDSSDTYKFSGYGFYRELLTGANGQHIPMAYALRFDSENNLTKEELFAGHELNLRISQQGQGSEIVFHTSLKMNRTDTQHVDVTYEGKALIATAEVSRGF